MKISDNSEFQQRLSKIFSLIPTLKHFSETYIN